MAARLQYIVFLGVLLSLAEAYTFVPKTSGKHRPSTKRWFTTQGKQASISMYLPPSSPTSQTPPMSSQSLLQDNKEQRTRGITLSNSVLASCDTLPSFPTAHGLLSPEVVMRMEKRTANTRRSSELENFLKTYRRHGPMSCLPMLSDPSVLPHLTEALRDIA